MGLLLVLCVLSLSVIPLSTSILDQKTIHDLELSNANAQMTSRAQLVPLNPFYQCDKYPKVCQLKSAKNPHCCKKNCVNVDLDRLNCGSCGKKCSADEACCRGKCVNVLTDCLNCGFCGMKCKYNESCCKGKCKNTFVDKRNCGGCQKKCKYWETCAYGMCNYA